MSKCNQLGWQTLGSQPRLGTPDHLHCILGDPALALNSVSIAKSACNLLAFSFTLLAASR